MLIAKSWFSQSEDNTIYKETRVQLWPWPTLLIEKHFYIKEEDGFKKTGFKEMLNWDTQDLIQGKYKEWIEPVGSGEIEYFNSSLGTFAYKQSMLKGKRPRGPLERKHYGMVLISFHPTTNKLHAEVVADLITWLRLELDEEIDGYVPNGNGFMGGTCFPEVIANSLDTIKEVKSFRNKYMANPTKF